MKILILNITINWVYNLYLEYITNIKEFINKYYKNIDIKIVYYDSNENKYKNEITYEKMLIYDKIFYTGDISTLNNIINIMKNLSNKIYFLNIEQMSHPSYYRLIRKIENLKNIIDYSEENIPFFNDIYKNIYLIPPYFKEIKINNINKDIDVLSIVNNLYRTNYINKIINSLNNINIKIIENCYGIERDDYFKRTKIYINIHGSENHNTMEMIRIVNLIMNKVIILTQNSVYSNLLFLKKYLYIYNDANDFNKIIKDILENYEIYYDTIYKDFDKNIYNDYIKENINKIINE
jgi:hypothetical protein